MFETVAWDEFERTLRWKQGEHVAIIGPTGSGKTLLETKLIPRRKYNLMFGTKIVDPQYTKMIKHMGFTRVERMNEIKPWMNNVLLWPRQRDTIEETIIAQQTAFRDAMNVIVKQKAWTLWVDEAKYLSEFLKLKTQLTFCLEQLRTANATVICGAQRPAWLSPSVLSNSSHVFLWKTSNREDAIKLADVGGVDARAVREEAMTLGEFEFLYIRTRGTDVKVVRTQVKEK